MNCPFCNGTTIFLEVPEILEGYDHHFEARTCPKCKTKDCSLEFNFRVTHEDNSHELINYCLKTEGYTAWVGVKYPGTEITHDWHTSITGTVHSTTMCHPILFTDFSIALNPENFSRRLKTILVFQ